MAFVRVSINGQRFYKIPGINEPFPSVTTILGIIHKPWFNSWQQRVFSDHLRGAMKDKPQFNTLDEELEWFDSNLKDANKQPDKIKQDAATLGSQAHDFIDKHLLTGMPPIHTVPEHLRSIVQGFETWRQQSMIEFVGRDSMVYSKTFRYAGSFDALARKSTDNSLVLIDWKTSNRISDQYAYQVAAYAYALGEMTNATVDEAWVVRFDKVEPVFEVRKVKNLQRSFQHFLSALNLFRAQEKDPWLPAEKFVLEQEFEKQQINSTSFSTSRQRAATACDSNDTETINVNNATNASNANGANFGKYKDRNADTKSMANGFQPSKSNESKTAPGFRPKTFVRQ